MQALAELLEPGGLLVLEKRPSEKTPPDRIVECGSRKNLWRNRSFVSATQQRFRPRDRQMIRFIYNLLWPLGLLLFLPGYLVKMFRRGGYREKFGQRLGFYDVNVRAALGCDENRHGCMRSAWARSGLR